MKKLIFATSVLLILSGCTCKYKEQLIIYQSTIGEKCMYYLNNDKKIDNDTKQKYYNINKETTKLLK